MTPEERNELIGFPCFFPIKVMGPQVDGFDTTVFNLIEQLTAQFDRHACDSRPSRTGKYLSLTCQVWVRDQEELDEVYRTLSTHPMVSVVL